MNKTYGVSHVVNPDNGSGRGLGCGCGPVKKSKDEMRQTSRSGAHEKGHIRQGDCGRQAGRQADKERQAGRQADKERQAGRQADKERQRGRQGMMRNHA